MDIVRSRHLPGFWLCFIESDDFILAFGHVCWKIDEQAEFFFATVIYVIEFLISLVQIVNLRGVVDGSELQPYACNVIIG